MVQSAAADPGVAGRTLDGAHRDLLTRTDLQFKFETAPRRPPADPGPEWLRALFRWLDGVFGALAPLVEILFWVLLAAAVLAILFLIVRELGGLDWAFKRKAKAAAPSQPLYRPDVAVAKALLADADALAAEGRFEEAVHALLLRSVEDMRRWRPRSVEPSLTSRDLSGLPVLPPTARDAFSAMARLVETSLFGGRPIGAEGFAASRKAYEDFALPAAWT